MRSQMRWDRTGYNNNNKAQTGTVVTSGHKKVKPRSDDQH